MARPTKYNDVTAAAVLRAIRDGNTEETAASAAGVAYCTFRLWKQRYPQFVAAIEKARAEAQANMVKVIVKAAPRNWQAAAWWLERRYPSEWGKVDRLELTLRQEAADVAAALGLDESTKSAAVAETERLLKEARARGRSG
jgi:uncharacterized protein YdiU (UPF0061 family)